MSKGRKTTKKCINCKRSDDTEFHEIFDEVGIELQLALLVEEHLKLKVTPNQKEQPVLCDDCVNELIELYDKAEKQKEQESPTEERPGNEAEDYVEGLQPVEESNEEEAIHVVGEQTADVSLSDDEMKATANVADETMIAVSFEAGVVGEDSCDGDKLVSVGNEATCDFEHDNVSDVDVKMASDVDVKWTINVHMEPSINVDVESNSDVDVESTNNVDVESTNDVYVESSTEIDLVPATNLNMKTASLYNDDSTSVLSEVMDAKTFVETFEILDWNDDDTIDSNFSRGGESVENAKDYSQGEWTALDENKYEVDEFDDTILQMYADATINSNFEELQLERESVCNLCSASLTKHQDLLLHVRENHEDHNSCMFPCVLDDCQQMYEEERLLARHIVLHHYDLRGITIFGSCPDCKMSFTNILVFNKHSCCRKLKFEKSENKCEDCKMSFPTFRRYRFHMQFHMKKSRPKVCLLCDRFFSDVEEFFEHVHYDHEPPSDMICTKCDRVYNNKKLYENHLTYHNMDLKFKCNLCSKAFSRNQWLKVHMQTHNNNLCEICNKTFTTANSYRNHMKLHQTETDVQTCVCYCTACGQIGREREDLQSHIDEEDSKCFNAAIEEDLVNVVYLCEYCENLYKSKEELKQHRATGVHEDKLFHCRACLATFDELRKVRGHFKTHKNYMDWQTSLPLYRLHMCDVGDCEQTYAMWLSLHSHKEMKHKELRLICKACDLRFMDQELFNAHLEKCHKDGKFICQYCGKVCATKMSRAVHIARSHNNKNFSCDSCSASFKDEESLRKHFDFIHIPMECPICRKKVKNKRNLVLHERVKHENAKRYFCDTCNKGFYHKSDMEAHERVTHSAISYVCEKCPFTTNYQNSLEIHMDIHNNDLKFECNICGRKFSRKHVMELHVKRHNDEREFVCSEYSNYPCSASFLTRYLLNRHIKEKHSSDDPYVEPPRKRGRRLAQRKVKNTELSETVLESDEPSESRAQNEESPEYLTLICFENEEKELLGAIESGYEVTEVLVTDYDEDLNVKLE